MAGGMSTMAREELIRTIRSRYRESTKMEKGRILDELAAVVGRHRKHAIRLLGLAADGGTEPTVAKGRRIYDEAVREALIHCLGGIGPHLREAIEGGPPQPH